MAIRYYDPVQGRDRVKPRYRWAATAFCIGLVAGMLAAHMI